MRNPFTRITYTEGFGRKTVFERVERVIYPWWMVVVFPVVMGLTGWKLVELLPL